MNKYIFHSVIISLFMSCSSQKNETIPIEEPGTPVSAISRVETKNIALNALLGQYYKLSDALTTGNINEARLIANAILAGAEKTGEKEIAEIAKQIVSSEELEAERKAYQNLSHAFIQRIKEAGMESGNLYIAHCPMAFNNKGASWITIVKEIKNPYFGEAMLTCGGIEETIQ